MKNIGSLVLIMLLLLGALVVFVTWGPLAEPPGMRELEGLPEAPAGTVPESGGRRPATKSLGDIAGTSGSGTASDSEVAPPSPVAGHATATGRADVRTESFPTSGDIATGMTKTAMLERFGNPTMRTSVVDRGRLIETCLYVRRDPNRATVVVMSGGTVIGVTTTVY